MMGNGNVCAEGLIGGLGIILLLTSFAQALTKCKYPNSSIAKTQSRDHRGLFRVSASFLAACSWYLLGKKKNMVFCL